MRAAEILRKLADIIDQAEQPDSTSGRMSPLTKGDDSNRFDQIKDLIPDSACDSEFANEPKEEYASIEAVTTKAGGGVNGPKHPHDIRVKDPSQHPGQQEY
jgi:hypothetical protein